MTKEADTQSHGAPCLGWIYWDLLEINDVQLVVEYTDRGSWRRKLIKAIHSQQVQLLLAYLLVLDVVVLFVHIFLEAHFPLCSIVQQSAECVLTDELGNQRRQQEHVVLICTSEDNKAVHTAEEALYLISVLILSIFMLELCTLWFLLGFFGFTRKFTYIFDFFVVGLSLSLEVALHNSEAGTVVGMLIFARFWRLVRISHGILFSSETRRKALGEAFYVRESHESLAETISKGFDLKEKQLDEKKSNQSLSENQGSSSTFNVDLQ